MFAMVLKIRKNLIALLSKSKVPTFLNSSGFTVIELTITFALISVLMMVLLFALRPAELNARARDNRRLSDIQTLDRIINEYKIDNGNYPDAENFTRTSTVIPTSSTGPLENISSGWISADFSDYDSVLPLDPTNDSTYFYSYRHNIFGYELNARFENYTDLAQNDGGDNNTVYETGDTLTLIN